MPKSLCLRCFSKKRDQSWLMISFLLYDPHALHTLWGTIRAPHLLHLTSVGAVIFQFALLLSLLPLEDLFLGHIDTVNTSFYTHLLIISAIYTFVNNNFQSREIKIFPQKRAPALVPAQLTLGSKKPRQAQAPPRGFFGNSLTLDFSVLRLHKL